MRMCQSGVLCVMLLCCAVGQAQEVEATEPAPESTAPTKAPAEIPEKATDQVTDQASAQADVTKARKLMEIRRGAEAVPLLESAYLVLDDPELLRLLAEAHLQGGDVEASRHYQEKYLSDVRVGERAREDARRRFAGLEGNDDEEFDLGVTGWQSGGAKIGTQGQWTLSVGVQLTLNESFSEPKTILNSSDDSSAGEVPDTWVHTGGGAVVDVSYFVIDGVSVGASLGLEVMQWQSQAPTPDFSVRNATGVRPELLANARWSFGAGFSLGLTAGFDMMVVTEDAPDAGVCANSFRCPVPVEGLLGTRILMGPLFGYQAELTESLAIGVEGNWKWVPVFVSMSDEVDEQQDVAGSSWMAGLSIALRWNL